MAGLQQQLVAHIKHKIIADNGARIRDGAVRLARDASKQNECLNVSKWVYVFGDASPRFASPTHDCWTTSFNQLDFPMAKFKSGIAVFYHTHTHILFQVTVTTVLSCCSSCCRNAVAQHPTRTLQ